MSYRKKHIKNKIHKIKPRKSILKKLWFWVVALIAIVVFTAAYFILFYSNFAIKNIVVSGNQKVAAENIKNLVAKNTDVKIFGIGKFKIDSKSIFLVDSKKLQNQILSEFPTIESVKIEKKYTQTLDVKVIERVPMAVFCPSLDKTIGAESCYSMDNSGTIFESLSTFPEGMVIVRQASSNSKVFSGGKVVSQNIVDIVIRAQKMLENDFQVNLIDASVTSSERLNINTSENWKIYFDLGADSNINSQFTKLDLLLKNEISADQRKNLFYIDLRPKDRAIICDNPTCGG